MDVSNSPLFPGNNIFFPHTHSLFPFLSLAFSHHLLSSHSSQNPSSTWIPLLFSYLLAVLLTSTLWPPSLSPPLSSQLQWALGDVSGISLTLHSSPRGSSHSFPFFSCHWLLGRIMHFGRVYSCLLITLLCTALKYCNMLRLVTKSICFHTDPMHLRHAELQYISLGVALMTN